MILMIPLMSAFAKISHQAIELLKEILSKRYRAKHQLFDFYFERICILEILDFDFDFKYKL